MEGNNGNVYTPREEAPGADALFTDDPGDAIIRGTTPEAAVASDWLLAGFTGDVMNTNGAGAEEADPLSWVIDAPTDDVGGKVNTIDVIAEEGAAVIDEVISLGTTRDERDFRDRNTVAWTYE